MKRKQAIQDAFHSVVPELSAGPWSVGYSGHTDNSSFFALPGFEVTGIRSVTSPVSVMNDVYVDYSYSPGVTGTTSIYTY
jgi:hypothetical protein